MRNKEGKFNILLKVNLHLFFLWYLPYLKKKLLLKWCWVYDTNSNNNNNKQKEKEKKFCKLNLINVAMYDKNIMASSLRMISLLRWKFNSTYLYYFDVIIKF